MQYGIIQNQTWFGPSMFIIVEENIEEIKNYFEQNLNAFIRKAVQTF